MSDDRNDGARERMGFLTVREMQDLSNSQSILDFHSTLISRYASLGPNNVLYPGTVIESDDASELKIGTENVFYPGSIVQAVRGGKVDIGDRNTFGPGGVQVKANLHSTNVVIGNDVRLVNGVELVGHSHLGDGSQIIGAIQAQSVVLEGGGGFLSAEVDGRGAVLKGFGLARGLRLNAGDVVNGVGDFSAHPVERQSDYHPRAN